MASRHLRLGFALELIAPQMFSALARMIALMTSSSSARRLWTVLVSLGGLLLVAAAAAAVLEGYASDAEHRTGNLSLAIVLAAVGVIAGVVGLIGLALRPGPTPRSVYPRTLTSSADLKLLDG